MVRPHRGLFLLAILPLILITGTLISGAAAMLIMMTRSQLRRADLMQARYLARSGLDVADRFDVPVTTAPPHTDTPTLLKQSTRLPLSVDGEIRIIHTPTQYLSIGISHGSTVVLSRSSPNAGTRLVESNE
jgi:hypothetical protein